VIFVNYRGSIFTELFDCSVSQLANPVRFFISRFSP